MGLLEKFSKIGTITTSSVLSKSKYLNSKDQIKLKTPILNVAFSADLQGGYEPGVTLVAGPSKHFKSNLCMVFVQAYLEQYPDAICIFYDSEFGTNKGYWQSSGIDPDRVLHIPVTNIEELKFDMMKKLEEINRGDKIIFFIDSIGNLASKKEVEDALKENSAADMSRAKQIKSYFRMITPHITMKDIPLFAIMHTYQSIELFPKTIVSGGTGGMLSANSVFIMGRAQEKENDEIAGWNFTLNVEKSRTLKEKSKIPLLVTYEGGINKYSGLIDLALESGHVVNPKKGWYAKVNMETGEPIQPNIRLKQTYNDEFWSDILADPTFNEFIQKKYQVSHNKLQETLDSIAEESDEDMIDYDNRLT